MPEISNLLSKRFWGKYHRSKYKKENRKENARDKDTEIIAALFDEISKESNKRRGMTQIAAMRSHTSPIVKMTKPKSALHSINAKGLLSNILIKSNSVNYSLYFRAEPLGTMKFKAFLTTSKSIFFAPLISPSIQIGIGVSNSILK